MKPHTRVVAIWVVGTAIALAYVIQEVSQAAVVGPPELVQKNLEAVQLHSTLMARDNRFGLLGAIASVGERYLVLVDRAGSPSLHILDRLSQRHVDSFGRKGEGPGEYVAPFAIDPVPRQQAFWVFDLSLQRLTQVDLLDGHLSDLTPVSTVTLKSDAPATGAFWIGADRILATGFFRAGRFASFDSSGRLRAHLGALPANPQGVPANVLQHAYQATAKLHPDRRRFAIATRHAPVIEIWSADGTRLHVAHSPLSFEPRFQVRQTGHGPVMASGPDLRFGYVDVAVTSRRIYGLFSGRTRAGFSERAPYAEYVHVYDWRGNLIQALQLDEEVFTIALDPADRELYAVRHEPVPAVLRYEISKASGGR